MADSNSFKLDMCCRLCGTHDLVMPGSILNDLSLQQKISTLVFIEVKQEDKFSTRICIRCMKYINEVHEFKESLLDNQLILDRLLHLQNSEDGLDEDIQTEEAPVNYDTQMPFVRTDVMTVPMDTEDEPTTQLTLQATEKDIIIEKAAVDHDTQVPSARTNVVTVPMDNMKVEPTTQPTLQGTEKDIEPQMPNSPNAATKFPDPTEPIQTSSKKGNEEKFVDPVAPILTTEIPRQFVDMRQYPKGSFLILKTEAQMSDPNKHPLIWRVDGTWLLQKYEPFEDGGKICHKMTRHYNGWSAKYRDLYAQIDVTVVMNHGNLELSVECNWDQIKELINNDSNSNNKNIL